jgi:peptidyl-prolyl cis-trans isomerase A (cyclophilin A)
MESSLENGGKKGSGGWKKALLVLACLAFVILVPLGVRSCLLTEGDWVACRITTTEGEIQVRVYPEKAPLTAANFLRYAEAGLYNGTAFFRVVTPENQPRDKVRIEVIQGGDVPEGKCFPPIAHETTAMTGLRHRDGAISMARAEPGTATSSFFICVGDQPELDFGGRRNPDGQGFAAFGRVVAGMDVVRRIQRLEADGQTLRKPIAIQSIVRLAKPSEIEGSYGKGIKGKLSDVWQAIRHAVGRMTFKDFSILLIILIVLGGLIWQGYGPRKFGRTDRQDSGCDWQDTRPWLRLLATLFILGLLALFMILMAA